MRLSVLGPLEVLNDNVPVPISSSHQRAALGVLSLSPNQMVSTDLLVKILWNGTPPPTARKMVNKAVSEIRTMLSTKCRGTNTPFVISTGHGYLLRIAPELVDLHRFLDLARRAREAMSTGSGGTAIRLLRQAMAMSRGPVLTDLVDTGVSWPKLRAVERQRLAVLEDLFDTALSTGRHRDVVGDLESLLDQDRPTERLIGQCMLALYRSGRQLDALNVYARMRCALSESHDREPGRELRELHLAILNQEENALGANAHPATVSA